MAALESLSNKPRLTQCWRWLKSKVIRSVLTRLALQNLGRRKTRTLLLITALAVAISAVFSTAILMWSINNSMNVGFSRLGADLLIVPPETLVNISTALLTAQPTENSFDSNLQSIISEISGVEQVAPQWIVTTDDSGYGHNGESVNLIGFDPEKDFTVIPWLVEMLERPLKTGDVILGGRRNDKLNSQIYLYGKPFTVYGRLSRTGVGTHEQGIFMTFDTLAMLAQLKKDNSAPFKFSLDQLSALLVKLKTQATLSQVRFAILAQAPYTKVVAGASLLTSVKQGLTALLTGILTLMLVMLLGIVLMVSVLFSAIITERRHELGILMAIGTQRNQIIRMILVEAVVATSCGGLWGVFLGGLLLRLYQRSLIYHLHNLGVSFAFPKLQWLGLVATGCVLLAGSVGILGSLYPAWQVTQQDINDLMGEES